MKRKRQTTKSKRQLTTFGKNNYSILENMKTKTLLLLIAFIVLGKIQAQTTNEEAVATYQLAQEEYGKHHFDKSLSYLDVVEKLSPEAKVKTSYLKAKCYETKLFNAPNINLGAYENCLDNISFYLQNGKDEDKKSELIKLKIEIKNSDDYKLILEYNNYSKEELYVIIQKIMQECAPSPGGATGGWSPMSNTTDWHYNSEFDSVKCILKLAKWYIYSGVLWEVSIHSINISDLEIQSKDFSEFQSIEATGRYNVSQKVISSIISQDITKYFKGINKNSCNNQTYKEENAKFYLSNFFDAKNQKSIDNNYDRKINLAFSMLIKKCKSGK